MNELNDINEMESALHITHSNIRSFDSSRQTRKSHMDFFVLFQIIGEKRAGFETVIMKSLVNHMLIA